MFTGFIKSDCSSDDVMSFRLMSCSHRRHGHCVWSTRRRTGVQLCLSVCLW